MTPKHPDANPGGVELTEEMYLAAIRERQDFRRAYAEARREVRRLQRAIEELVQDEVISASRAREIHHLLPEEQRELWREMDREPAALRRDG